ncbi:hypothetical protein PoB_000010100 [Plakobranchus ocellatus]|uniref:Protein RFT1 homolog n=1 Tax=Plakobranchus ocellatus TaxID=259542 RepID=A0AAV3WRI9_9GAST|nr:hypothetical protein PoB_000010100 [Plakobranchus ocellatus]
MQVVGDSMASVLTLKSVYYILAQTCTFVKGLDAWDHLVVGGQYTLIACNLLARLVSYQIFITASQSTAARGCEHWLGISSIGRRSKGQVGPSRVQGQRPWWGFGSQSLNLYFFF